MPTTNNMCDSHADEIDRESLVGAANEPHAALPEKAANKKRAKRDVHGWVVLDKPIGMTSTHAVAVIKRLLPARSTRSLPVACRSRLAKRPKPCRSWWTAARCTSSRCAGAKSATPTMPKAAS